jgi:transcriptional regulator with XRE-family HTH domain
VLDFATLTSGGKGLMEQDISLNIRKELGKKAQKLRKSLKKTQDEVAQALGIPRTDISGFESRGERITTLEKIEKLFNFYGYTFLEPT